jgi:ABC-type antimicrobial peptide transport system permease subunit
MTADVAVALRTLARRPALAACRLLAVAVVVSAVTTGLSVTEAARLTVSDVDRSGGAIGLPLAALAALALIALSVLASLTMADADARRHDFAVRASLGGSSVDLAAPELAQSLLLAATGGVMGVVGAVLLVPPLLALDRPMLPADLIAAIDWRATAGGLGAAVLVMLSATAAPILLRESLSLRSGCDCARAEERPAVRARIALVIGQTALAVVLVSAGFLEVSLGSWNARAMIVGAAGAMGMVLATIGTYGATARSVMERRHEMGIRLALGGRPRHVWWSLARSSLRAVAVGGIVGAGAANLTSAVIGAMLPELQGGGWMPGIAAAGLLLVSGGLAVSIAARAAASIDPLVAMRTD